MKNLKNVLNGKNLNKIKMDFETLLTIASIDSRLLHS